MNACKLPSQKRVSERKCALYRYSRGETQDLDGGCEVKLAPLAPLHVELEPDEPVAADLLLPILQAAVGLRPDVRQVDRLPLQVGNQVPHLALYKADPLELILLTLTGSLKHNEVAILGEKVGRFKKFVPRGLGVKKCES